MIVIITEVKEGEKKSWVKNRLEKVDKEKLQKKADSLRIKLSTYIRMVSLNADIKMETSNRKWMIYGS